MHASGETMASKAKQNDEMRSHYDFSGGERGKYAARFAEGTNVVVLAPDVAAMFPDSIAVNEALRTFVAYVGQDARAKAAPKKRVRKKIRRRVPTDNRAKPGPGMS
jgi:hypothetical protein